MIVSELIERLLKLPQDKRVVIRGYEYGQTDINTIEEVSLYINYHGDDPTYGGAHEVVDRYDSVESGFEVVSAVKISWSQP